MSNRSKALQTTGSCRKGGLVGRFVVSALLAAVLSASSIAALAESSFVLGTDIEGAPGFGEPGLLPQDARIQPGAAGTGDYARFLGLFSIVNPENDISGLWGIFRVTRDLCGALYRGEKGLVEAAPKGFFIERGDVFALGWKNEIWDGTRYAVTKTGDSERDVVGGHPAWEVIFFEDGRLRECGVTFGSAFGSNRNASAASEDARKSAVTFMYVTVPHFYSAILVEPQNAGAYGLQQHDLLIMLTPCGASWCRTTTTFDFSEGNWYVQSSTEFNLPLKAD
ncbi:hypothetical protein [Roseibium sp. MMSF_3412]|uniref:hypothetical protein n=1 Tax=Roseibium sp. MMSF_3412 TaxID=3046712 RepID=UPI00273F0A89|nr:hypothetical protein [Roseibium sp. MMSF_3412]